MLEPFKLKKKIMGEIEVLEPGLLSSVQDSGRRGYLQFGVPVGGAMDSFSAGMANLLLGNSAGAAVLEITQLGPKLRFSESTRVAICGADLSPEIDQKPVAPNEILEISAGSLLSFGRRIKGSRTYLAVQGGLKTQELLGSKSWYSGLTELGRIEKGTLLLYKSFPAGTQGKNASLKLGAELFSKKVEAFRGPEFRLLTHQQQEELGASAFVIDRNSNRMGFRLQQHLENQLNPIISAPVLPGTVQLTASGRLIVLMRDAQTTGGYPRVLQLTETSINVLAQKVPGDEIHFSII